MLRINKKVTIFLVYSSKKNKPIQSMLYFEWVYFELIKGFFCFFFVSKRELKSTIRKTYLNKIEKIKFIENQ